MDREKVLTDIMRAPSRSHIMHIIKKFIKDAELEALHAYQMGFDDAKQKYAQDNDDA